jgi:hypothetical protein
MMEQASTPETLVNYQTTRRDNPEDSHLHIRRCENLKYDFIIGYISSNKFHSISFSSFED